MYIYIYGVNNIQRCTCIFKVIRTCMQGECVLTMHEGVYVRMFKGVHVRMNVFRFAFLYVVCVFVCL